MKPVTLPEALLMLALVVLGAGASAPAHAMPFVYQFDVNFLSNTDPSVFGTGQLQTITFDNGQSTNQNQIYAYGDIVNLSARSIGGSFFLDGSLPQTFSYTGDPAHTFATTDSAGLIALKLPFAVDIDLGDSILVSNGGAESVVDVEWSILGTWTVSAIDGPDVYGGLSKITGSRAFGSISPRALPEPATFALFTTAFALILLGRAAHGVTHSSKRGQNRMELS